MPGEYQDDVGRFDVYEATVIGRLGRTLAVELLSTRLDHGTFFIEAIRKTDAEPELVGEGSAFVISVAPPVARYLPDYFVVTARHNVEGAHRREATIWLLLPFEDGEYATIEMPWDAWTHGDHDVSVALLPLDRLPPKLELLAIPLEALTVDVPIFSVSTVRIELYGRAKVGATQFPIVRGATLPTVGKVHVAIEGVQKRVPVWLAEGTVTVGMSGGPVLATKGTGETDNLVMGLIHGYAHDELVQAPPPGYKICTDEVLKLREELLRELAALRQSLIYIVPGDAILETIEKAIRFEYPKRFEP